MAEHDNINQQSTQEQYQNQNYSQQSGYNPNTYGYANQGYSQQAGYDPNAYGYANQGYSQQAGYDPNAYGYANQGYSQQAGYDPNAYGYANQGYSQQAGYDPNTYGYANQGYSQQAGYDPNAYGYANQGYSQQAGYDPNTYGYANQGYSQQSQDPQNPLRVTLNPNNPSTSSNNITLNLDSLYEKMSHEINKSNEIIDYNKEIKDYITYLMQSNASINIFSYLGDSESSIASGSINTVNNNTISINSKIVALKFISYIQFNGENISDISINQYFYHKFMQSTPKYNNNFNNINDFYNFLNSKKSFSQYVSIVVSSSFLTEIPRLTVIDLNEKIVILKSDESYYMVPLDKIVSIE